MREFRYLPTQAAIDAAAWLRTQNVPSEQWVVAPDLCHWRFEIIRRQTGIYETRWLDGNSACAGDAQVNPARLAEGLSEIKYQHAKECFRIMDKFFVQWRLGSQADGEAKS